MNYKNKIIIANMRFLDYLASYNKSLKKTAQYKSFKNISGNDFILQVFPSSFTIFNKRLEKIAEFGADANVNHVWKKVEEFINSGVFKPGFRLYSTTKSDIENANLTDITGLIQSRK